MRHLLLGLMALLPLQWFVVPGGLRFHVVAIGVFTALVAPFLAVADLRRVLAVARPFVVANFVLVVVWAGANVLYNGLGVRQPLQQGVYLLAFLAVGTVVLRGLRTDGRWADQMRWSVVVTTTSLLAALSFSMAANGVNAGDVFLRTLAAADPDILQRELFRSAFGGFGFDEDVVKGNIRHEVFGSLLVAMCVSAACVQMRPWTSRWAGWTYRVFMVAAGLLLVLSMSRSVMIAGALWVALYGARQLLAGRIAPRTIGVLAAGGVTVALLAGGGVVQVLWVRFTQDTSSYAKRDELMARALSSLGSSMFSGGVQTADASSHNFVIDTWLRAGVLAAAAAVVVVVVTTGLFVALAAALPQEPGWVLPVTALLALPCVRFFTAGGGLIPPVGWVALGLVAGFLAHRAGVKDQEADRGARRAGAGPVGGRG